MFFMGDSSRQPDVNEAEEAADMLRVPDVTDFGAELMENPGTPFDELLDARGLSRDPDSQKNAVAVLVDDDDGVHIATPDILKMLLNVDVVTAVNGKEGLNVLRECHGRVAFVLSDIDMPGMNGPKMLRTARERGFLDSRVPVLLATADILKNKPEIDAAILDGVARGFSEKPFGKPVELMGLINAACARVLEEMKSGPGDKDVSSDEICARIF